MESCAVMSRGVLLEDQGAQGILATFGNLSWLRLTGGSVAGSAVTGISNLAMANLRRLPPGTLPPVVLKFDASSLPVCLITLKGQGLNETQLRESRAIRRAQSGGQCARGERAAAFRRTPNGHAEIEGATAADAYG